MNADWQPISLGRVLKRVERFEPRDDLNEYSFAGTYSFARGIFVGERKLGATFKLPKVQRVKEGDFVYCKIMAWEGAFGTVPPEANNCVMSGAFVAYEHDESIVDSRYLDWYFRAPSHWQCIGRQSTGTNVRRQSLHPDQFESSEIRLPPLDEQRRIVARIENFAIKVKEARRLRQISNEEVCALIPAHLGTVFRNLADHYPVHPLGELSSHIVDGPHQTPNYLSDKDGVPFVTVKNMVTGTLSFSELNYVSTEDHREFTRRCRAERGDVLYSKDGATKGRPCYVDTDREFSFFVSVALIKPMRDRLDSRYLVHLLNSSWIKDRMIDKSRGDMIPHIVLREIRAFPVPLPSLDKQREIVAELDVLKGKVDAVKALQEETAAELNAMLPTILDKAFKGEL
jgi:type I restriction enzyme S subunit